MFSVENFILQNLVGMFKLGVDLKLLVVSLNFKKKEVEYV